MNYLIIILIIFYFAKNKNDNIYNILKNIDYEDVLPIIKLFDFKCVNMLKCS